MLGLVYPLKLLVLIEIFFERSAVMFACKNLKICALIFRNLPFPQKFLATRLVS